MYDVLLVVLQLIVYLFCTTRQIFWWTSTWTVYVSTDMLNTLHGMTLQSSFQAILLGSFLILCVDQSTQKDWEHTASKNWPAQLCCFGLRPS